MKDLIIIGAGPAGLAASIYGIRAGLDCVVVERYSPGGQVMNTDMVENYPGFAEPVGGWELMSRMEEQARRLGVEIMNGEIASVDKNPDTGIFQVKLSDGSAIESRTVIIATGASFRKLGVPGEAEFTGRGVSYCATCDGAFFKGKDVVVVGGGDVALEEAHFLTRFASRVFLVHRRDAFRGAKILQDRIHADEKITPVMDSVIETINGSVKVEGVTLANKKTGDKKNLEAEGVFIFVGYDPNTGFLPAEILNQAGEVVVDMNMNTQIKGLFAAGDIRSGSKRQIVMAAADGATAALEAYNYISSLE
ncbi:MAG TPA: thioredoxin-disulfide reductase [Spirochaetota bacterium]|nr:thioredoxin-disulfide reductase [Spirochaetota bacterium]HPI89213.1 thioredoxin-disulfide reductase [Spirochaetota bacterium]HPR48970.1 thioredoxin-disulfide reductase [Spirochaetota bacterium]